MATPPYAYRVTRVTIEGTFGASGEIWTTGFYMGNVSADADLPTQQLADDIRTAYTTFHTTAGSYISNSCNFTGVKVSSIGTDGKSDANDTVYSNPASPVQGARVEIWPPQISLAATLIGVSARGLASKGRMYLPGVVRVIDNTYKIDGTNQASILTNVKNFITACNASTATPNVVILASHGQLNKDRTPKLGGLGPVNHEVTAVRLGNVYDTQRRRRNGLTENYQTQTLGAS